MNAVSKPRVNLPVFLMFLAAAITFAVSCQMRAQTAVEAAKLAAEAAKTVSNLPPESRAVVERLSNLRVLPDGVWKMHSGDLAHGEAVNVDEAGWQTIEAGKKAPNEAVWFRQTYEVPATLYGYDLTGSRIWFQFHAEANGPMPEILYFNGRRVAMGDDLEPVVLFDQAKPGDKVTVAVKLLHT
ncbi:MAG: alpha-mannosidase, partial [Terracidiphilus sp.]